VAFALIIAKGRGRGRRYRFDGSVSLGRDAANDVVLNQAAVSRVHARIERQGEGWALLDRGSANGTELNGAPVAGSARLREGDRIGVGGALFEFRAKARAARLKARWRNLPAPVRATLIAGAVLLGGIAGERAMHLADPRAPGGAGLSQAERLAALSGTVPAGPVAGFGVEAARAAYERGRRKLRERRIAPRNLYDGWRAFVEARGHLETAGERSAVLAELDALIGDAERGLERECRRLLFTASRFERYGEAEKAQQAWREILLQFPGDDPAGCHRKAQDNLVSPQPDDADG
jgi:hypothetical protein